MQTSETPQQRGGIVNYFQGATIHNIVINGNMSRSGTEHYHTRETKSMRQEALAEELPTRETMCQAVESGVKAGLWWGNQSWAVVYRVYQLKGYTGSMSDFVREAQTWPLDLAATCTYDAVQKPIARGTMIGQPDKWLANGAPQQAVALAESLLTEMAEDIVTPQ